MTWLFIVLFIMLSVPALICLLGVLSDWALMRISPKYAADKYKATRDYRREDSHSYVSDRRRSRDARHGEVRRQGDAGDGHLGVAR